MTSLLRSSRVTAGLAVAVLATAAASPSDGALINGDFDFRMSAYEESFMMPDGAPIPAYLCGDPVVEMVRHMKPYFILTNNSGVTFEGMELSIGDTDYHFADVLGVGAASDLSFDELAVSFNSDESGTPSSGIADQDYLALEFTGGLAPGESVVVRVDLGHDDPSFAPFPDFREVLFETVSATPTSDSMISTLAISTDDPDCDLPHTAFMPLSEPTPDIGFGRTSQGLPATTTSTVLDIIPEPTAALTAALGVVGVALRRRG